MGVVQRKPADGSGLWLPLYAHRARGSGSLPLAGWLNGFTILL